MKYFLATHVGYDSSNSVVYGPAEHVFDYLRLKNKTIWSISHPLYFKGYSFTLDNKNNKRNLFNNNNEGFVIGSLKHIHSNLKTINSLRNKEKIYFIGVDPINGLSGILLKIFNISKKFVYLNADYADERFENKILNTIYHFLDRLCLLFCDEVWCVSSRIVNKRIKQGKPENKVKLLPNSPNIKDFKLNNNKKRDYRFVIVTNITKSLNLKPILESLKSLSVNHNNVALDIIGSGDSEEYYKQMVNKMGLEKKVFFLGPKSHDEVISILPNYFLGFAIYTTANNFNYYGDSMKAREYVASGVPTIINNIPSTADDIKKYEAGLVIDEVNSKEITEFIEKCISDEKYYSKFYKNALKMAKDYDKENILTGLLK